MDDDGLPAETGPPISEDLQQRGLEFLRGLLASGKVDLDRFQEALDALLVAQTQPGLGEVRLEGRWQVSRLTKIDGPVRWPVADANASSRHEDRESVATSRARSSRNKWLPSARIPAPQKLGPEHRRSDLV